MTAPMLCDVLLHLITEAGGAGATEGLLRDDLGFKAPHPELLRKTLLQMERDGKVHRHELRWRLGKAKPGAPKPPEPVRESLPSREERGLQQAPRPKRVAAAFPPTCPKCLAAKTPQDFYPSRRDACRLCVNAYSREYQRSRASGGRVAKPIAGDFRAGFAVVEAMLAKGPPPYAPPPEAPRPAPVATPSTFEPRLSDLSDAVLLNILTERLANRVFELVLARFPHLQSQELTR